MNIPNVNTSDFWNQKYINDDFGWDVSSVTPIFLDYFSKINDKKNIFVPGCGLGHDVIYLAEQGHNVTALDFSSFAINHINQKYNNSNLKTIKEDFFKIDSNYFNKFDIVLEYTFFCAIHPSKRSLYVDLIYKLLKKKGILVAVFIPVNKLDNDEGPPFGVDINKVIQMFSNKFRIIKNEKSSLSIEPRKDSELFVIMKKI